ncbi:MAG TPA: cysteine dioxygenase family protein [Solirubrobacteraceae bacterium]|jgi:uncharacterized cupin superfamily protein
MSHHDDRFFPVPAHLLVRGAVGLVGELRLIVKGQGTISFVGAEREPFGVTLGAPDLRDSPAFRWDVGHNAVTLWQRTKGDWRRLRVFAGQNVGLDPDEGCRYWFSIDSHNRRLAYGKGEMRLATRIASYDLAPATPEGGDEHRWLSQLDCVHVAPPIVQSADVWRDPVTTDPPMRIVPSNRITMSDVAECSVTVVENLTTACQRLYANVAGEQFVLDSPDFPEFSQAIQESIDNVDGWCHQTLMAKATEFGPPDPDRTYLRITMGINQGESPGIPFVMEIWPGGHFSPIHNHGGADAVIKVLHGEICVSLYRMLSSFHQEPFERISFAAGEVTWITPRLNQTHMLRNEMADACVTIQCYTYPESDTTHYPYFDYLDRTGIAQFIPGSDMEFLAFKARMKEEWARRLTSRVVSGQPGETGEADHAWMQAADGHQGGWPARR